MWSVFLTTILCCVFARCRGNGCDPFRRPADEFLCSNNQSSSAVNYQWYVCINDESLQLLTGGSDRCPNREAYCWQPCSVGNPTAGCTCSKQATFPSHPSLPSWCFNPPGKTCSWYRECLNAKQPCGDSKYDYALSFGGHFCEAFVKTYHTFSSRAQEWIDAVRRCLQVKLVYILRPWESLSCQEIQAAAFASHTGCYLSPASGALSICSLGALDWWRVFWTIKGAFVSETYQTIKGFLEVTEGCLPQLGSEMRSYSAVVKLCVVSDVDTSVTDNLDIFAREIADKIARKLKWDSSTLDWYAYTRVSAKAWHSSHSNQLILLLGDKVALGMAQATETSSPTNLEEIVRGLTAAAESWCLDGIVKIESLKACSGV